MTFRRQGHCGRALWIHERRDYRERRFITAGWLRDRFVVVVWTPRGNGRRIISMRYGHADEEAYYREQMVDPDEAPPLDRDWFERAEIREGGQLIRQAKTGERPRKPARKEAVTLRLDPDVLAYFRAAGRSWQSRINAVLRKAAGLAD
jgi:uncharacterized protein (DUF4415 family)